MSHLVAPSILASNFLNLGNDIQMLNKSDADWIHVDVMDGHFVPNLSFGLPIIKQVKSIAQKPLDVHLMISNPELYIDDYQNAGADILTVHAEVCAHLHRTLQQIQEAGMKRGVAINPHTQNSVLENVIDQIDVICVMSVNPGFGGQKFIERTYEKVKELKKMINDSNSQAKIEIDGGVTIHNARNLVDAGADVLVAGSAVFKAENPIEMIHSLKSA